MLSAIVFILGVFAFGFISQIVLLQINLWRYHKKNPNAHYDTSRWVFGLENIDFIVLPELTEGMLLSATILFSYLYVRYFTTFFTPQIETNILHFVIPPFLVSFFSTLIILFFFFSIIIGCFSFRLPALLKFISYCWFLVCSIALLLYFTGKVYLYFSHPAYIYQDTITMYFTGFNILPLMIYLMSIRWLFPNKKKSVIEHIGLMIEKMEDKQLSWQRTFLVVAIQGGILLINGFLHIVEDAAIIGFFLATMPFLHFKPRTWIRSRNMTSKAH